MSGVRVPAPDRLVEGGRLRAGYYSSPARDPSLADAGSPVTRWARQFRLKEWVAFGITHPDWYVSMIVQDAKYLASSALYAFDRRSGKLHEYSRASFDRSVEIPRSLWKGRCRLEGKGYLMEFDHALERGEHRLRLALEGRGGAPSIEGEIALSQDLSRVEPLVVLAPVGARHFMYTHKAPMPASGELRIGGERAGFEPARDLGNLDEHKALYPYHTRWRWLTFVAFDARGGILGANLAEHMTAPGFGENCAWFDGRLSRLGEPSFRFDRADPMKPWTITTVDGRASLRFVPEGRKDERKEFGVARIRYYQLCGRFEGWLADESGARRDVPGCYGVCEMMDTWF